MPFTQNTETTETEATPPGLAFRVWRAWIAQLLDLIILFVFMLGLMILLSGTSHQEGFFLLFPLLGVVLLELATGVGIGQYLTGFQIKARGGKQRLFLGGYTLLRWFGVSALSILGVGEAVSLIKDMAGLSPVHAWLIKTFPDSVRLILLGAFILALLWVWLWLLDVYQRAFCLTWSTPKRKPAKQ